MLKKGFLKPEISIDNLGKRHFWTGIIMGVLASFVLSYLFNYLREALRLLTFQGDLLNFPEKEFRLYDLFFAAFSSSLGFGFTIIYWLGGRNKTIKRRYLKSYAIANAWFITMIALMAITRMGSVLPFILYRTRGYDNNLDFLHEFRLLLILIPVYVFFAQWNSIRLMFKTKNWVLISVVFYCLLTFYLYKTTYVDRNIINQKYYSQNKERFDFIDEEFKEAGKLGIFFSDTTRQILQKRYAERTTRLVLALKQAFNKNKTVPLDTLILEKIVIHNLNRHEKYFYGPNREIDRNWSYALPEDVYYQIKKHPVNSAETRILFDILKEEVSLFAVKDIKWDKTKYYTFYEMEKSDNKHFLFRRTQTIQSRLIQVVNKLKSEKEYEKYTRDLPNLKFVKKHNWQKNVEIDLAD